MKRIQAKNIKQELMKLIKYLYHALMIKDLCQIMEFILQLIFIKIVIKNVIRMKMKMKLIIIILIMKNDNNIHDNDDDNKNENETKQYRYQVIRTVYY